MPKEKVKEKEKAKEEAASEAGAEAAPKDKTEKQQKKARPAVKKLLPGEENLRYIVRVAGVDLDGTKPVARAIRNIKGVGWNFASAVVGALSIDANKKLGLLTEEEVSHIEGVIKNPAQHGICGFVFNHRKDFETGSDMHVVSSDLIFTDKKDIEFLKKIKCYRGVRHFYGMKLRGQRTCSRGGGQRGRSGKTVGVLRKKLLQAAAAAKAAEAEKPKESKPAAKPEAK